MRSGNNTLQALTAVNPLLIITFLNVQLLFKTCCCYTSSEMRRALVCIQRERERERERRYKQDFISRKI